MNREEYTELYGEEFVSNTKRAKGDEPEDHSLAPVGTLSPEERELMSGTFCEGLYTVSLMEESIQRIKKGFNQMWEGLCGAFQALADSMASAFVDVWDKSGLSDTLDIILLAVKNQTDCNEAERLGLVNKDVLAMARGERNVRWRTINKNMNRVRKELRLHEKRSTPAGCGKRWVKKVQVTVVDESSTSDNNTDQDYPVIQV